MTLSRLPAKTVSHWLMLPLLLWGLAGCASLPTRRAMTGVNVEIGSQLLANWQKVSTQHKALDGVAKVRLQTAERTVNITQVVIAVVPDRLRVETLSPFGTPLMVLATDGTDLGISIPGDNVFYVGRATPENFSRFARLPLSPADLVDMLLARPPVIAYQSLATFLFPGNGYQVDLTAGESVQRLFFDLDRHLREVDYLVDNVLQLSLSYDAFDPEHQGLPRQIELDLPRQKIHASLSFKEIATAQVYRDELFTLTPPAGAAIMQLDAVASAAASSGHVPPLLEPQQVLPWTR